MTLEIATRLLAPEMAYPLLRANVMQASEEPVIVLLRPHRIAHAAELLTTSKTHATVTVDHATTVLAPRSAHLAQHLALQGGRSGAGMTVADRLRRDPATAMLRRTAIPRQRELLARRGGARERRSAIERTE